MANVLSIVSYPFLPARVGGQKGVALFNKYFSRFHHLVCVTTRRNDPFAAEGYEVLNILSDSRKRYINIFYFFRIRSLIKANHVTHLILEHPYYGWLGVLLKWFTGVRLIVHSHNMEGNRWKDFGKWWWSILWIYEKYTHRFADFNFFIHDEDLQYAIDHFGLEPSKCMTVTYGIERDRIPDEVEIRLARSFLKSKFSIRPDQTILLFNGAFNYYPNQEALDRIISTINPQLQKESGLDYRILICGRDIPKKYLRLNDKHITVVGFVEDIDIFFKGADVFINPISFGGGIKTKLVEALGFNLNAVSTQWGALGIDPAICNGKLLLSKNKDWEGFVKLITQAASVHRDTPSVYFDHFYWGNTTRKAAEFIEGARG